MTRPLNKDNVEMLQFKSLKGNCNIFHFVTTRSGGVSKGSYCSFNLGEYCGDDQKDVSINRERLCRELAISPSLLFVPFQTHEDHICIIDKAFLAKSTEEQAGELQGVDALITKQPGICIGVTTADCVPLLLYSPEKNIVAAVHAGWRGTVKRITTKTVNKMVDNFDCDPSKIIACIGPSISKDSFEVGAEVVTAFKDANFDTNAISSINPNTQKWHIDLWEANRISLKSAGIMDENIEIAGKCSYQLHEHFFSARRLETQSGRTLSGIGIKE